MFRLTDLNTKLLNQLSAFVRRPVLPAESLPVFNKHKKAS